MSWIYALIVLVNLLGLLRVLFAVFGVWLMIRETSKGIGK